MGFGQKKPTFNIVVRSMKGKKRKNYLCLAAEKRLKHSNEFFEKGGLVQRSEVQKTSKPLRNKHLRVDVIQAQRKKEIEFSMKSVMKSEIVVMVNMRNARNTRNMLKK